MSIHLSGSIISLSPFIKSGAELISILRSKIGEEIPHLRRYARALVFCPATADDLVQASVERALVKESSWDPEKPLRPWMFRILHNLHISGVRGQQREKRFNQLQPTEEGFSPDHENSSELERVQSAMEQLPDDQRETILLIGVEGFSYDEAATILEVPMGTVRSRLSRAREGLRQRMETEPRPVTQRGEAS